MDTTLRDGEQTSGVSLTGHEKLTITQLLIEGVRADRIEIASARVSEGERQSVSRIMEWANSQGEGHRVECLGFTDHKGSADWLLSAGCKVMNLLTKGSLHHLEGQLRKTPKQHVADIAKTVEYCVSNGIAVNVYFEDWSNGCLNSPDYVNYLYEACLDIPFTRIMLPDTLGVLNPNQVTEFVGDAIGKLNKFRIDFHGHNDYGFATANSLAAVLAGADGIHCTLNGLGERAGNTCLDEVAVVIEDHTDRKTRINLKRLKEVSKLIEALTGLRISDNKPITGDNVFTQTAGIHADGDKKGNLYESRLNPKRFGRDREYALGKLSGRANIDLNLRKMGIELTEEQKKKLLDKVIELGDNKKVVTKDDIPFLLTELLETPEERSFEILNSVLVSSQGLSATAAVRVRYRDGVYEANGLGNGGYDAFMTALRSIEERFDFEIPAVGDYEVHIPPGGKSDALVETTITWANGLRTRGVDSDQIMAAIEATSRMMNLMDRQKGMVKKKDKSKTRV
ncbi:MAG: 2-isopropylmalate synthase [Candidatus Omnitrophica bacterium]|nr:2-isopropylmalate synthase [Candidatus Omnitrophota bacterium]